jgi:hypothetical protein
MGLFCYGWLDFWVVLSLLIVLLLPGTDILKNFTLVCRGTQFGLSGHICKVIKICLSLILENNVCNRSVTQLVSKNCNFDTSVMGSNLTLRRLYADLSSKFWFESHYKLKTRCE